MTIRQVHYTSCRQGRDGIDGFQVAASTPGLAAQHEQLALPLAAYRPGPAAPPVPTAEQVARFPVALGYRSFGEFAVLFHSRYVGVDFTGRQGNYFAHLLVLDAPDRDLDGLLPAETWGCGAWAAQLTGSPELAALTAVPAGPLADRHRLRTALAPLAPAFTAVLGAVVQALACRPRRVVVVAADVGDVATVLAAVTRSLPATSAVDVSFTTFSSAPADVDLLVVGTTPDVTVTGGPYGDQAVVRLDEPAVDQPAAYADLLGRRWTAGAAAVDALVDLADRVHPPLQAGELDAFAPFAELSLADAPAQVALAGLEFAADRYPQGLTAHLWRRLDAATHQHDTLTDVVRWSAALVAARGRGAAGPGPALEVTYLRTVLSAVAARRLDPTSVWLPRSPGFDGAVVDWATGALRSDSSLDLAEPVLSTVHGLGVRLRDADLREVADLVLIPRIVDPDDVAAPTRIRALPDSARLLSSVCEQLDDRLDVDDLFDAAVHGLSAPAAELLAGAAPRGSRCATAARLTLARAGHRDRVRTLVTAAGHDDPHELGRYASLIWPDLPTAADGALICRSFVPAVLAASGLPERLVERLVADARGAGLAPADDDLARGLSAVPVLAGLAPQAAEVVRAVRLGGVFRGPLERSADNADLAVEATLLAERVDPAIGTWLADAVATWLLAQDSSLFHAPLLHRLVAESRTGGFLTAYGTQLRTTLTQAEPPMIAAILPAVVSLANDVRGGQDLLDTVCRDTLRDRRSRDLDLVGRALDARKAILKPLLPGTAKDWPSWWEGWRGEHLGRSGIGHLRGLFGKRGRPGGER